MKKEMIFCDSLFLLAILLLILVIVPSSLALHQGQVHDADRDGVPDEDLNNDGIPDDRCSGSLTTDVDQFGCDCQQKTSNTCLISFPGINCCVPDNNPCTDDCGKGEISYATCNIPNNAPCQNGYCSGGRCVLQVNRQRSSQNSATNQNPSTTATNPPLSCELNLPSSIQDVQEFTATWNGPGNSMEVRTIFNEPDGIHNRNERLITANNFLYQNLPVSGIVEGLHMHSGAAVTVVMNWKDANGNAICRRTSTITAQPNSAPPQLIVNPSNFYQGDVVNVRVNNVQSGQTIYLHVNEGNGVPLGTATGSNWERIFQSHETRFTPGTYSIAVSAGGIQSAPVQVTISPR
ncbi:hypothetical protein HYY71_04385 [Candidatus Woesearchaeota archaeon]|nr:hypothetical protein [Candidatus Woesearchaeota archaeon]